MHFFFTTIVAAGLLASKISASALLGLDITAGTLEKRDTPDCMNMGASYSGYSDGQGTYVDSDNSHRSSGTHCWDDYFIVEQNTYMAPWTKSSGDIYCTGTSSCIAQTVKGSQQCYTHSTSISADIGFTAMNISAKLGVEVSNESQKCVQQSLATSCTWSDQGCHTVWTQQQMVHQVSLPHESIDRVLMAMDVIGWLQTFAMWQGR